MTNDVLMVWIFFRHERVAPVDDVLVLVAVVVVVVVVCRGRWVDWGF